jgi:hypothetical protein
MCQVVELPSRRKAARNAVNGNVRPPTRCPNRETRTREFLTPDEVDRLLEAVGQRGFHDGCVLGSLAHGV